METLCEDCVGRVELRIKQQGSQNAKTFIICKDGYSEYLMSMYGGFFEFEHSEGVVAPMISECSKRVPPA